MTRERAADASAGLPHTYLWRLAALLHQPAADVDGKHALAVSVLCSVAVSSSCVICIRVACVSTCVAASISTVCVPTTTVCGSIAVSSRVCRCSKVVRSNSSVCGGGCVV
jgi:hypothetical protein